MRFCLVVCACVATLLIAVRADAAAAGVAQAHVRALRAGAAEHSPVVIALLPAGERAAARVPGLSIGLMSAAQGTYSREQLLLDMTQGARVATSAYAHPRPAPLA